VIQLKDIKEAVTEIMNEIDYNQLALDNAEDAEEMRENSTFWSDRTAAEKELLKKVVAHAGGTEASRLKFTDVVLQVAQNMGMDPGDWPTRSKAWKGDIKFYPKDALNWVCHVSAKGLEGAFGNKIIKPSGGCPETWGAKEINLAGAGGGNYEKWKRRLSREEQQVLSALTSKVLNREIAIGTDISDSLLDVASELGISKSALPFLREPDRIKAYLHDTLPRGLKESKKRGFGEGEPPPEEIYKKREIVQEVELETPDIAKELGDASKEQGEATMGVADAHTRGAEAAKQRQDASKAWKGAKITQIKAVDAAEKYADQEAKAIDAQGKAMDAAQKAAAAGEKASAEKEKMLGVAKQAHEQEKEAASAAVEAAAAEEEAATELADTNTAASETDTERSELETEFGDAVASDEEAKEEAGEDAEVEEEEEKKADQEAEAKAKEEERKASDEKATDDAEAEEEQEEEGGEEDESSAPKATFNESLMSMIREEYKLLGERKWGDKKGAPASPQQKLQKAGLTADDLRSMVLNTVMQGEEERDREMIKLLKDMLMSLQSIEYHTTPVKGAGSKHAQTAATAWVSESKNRERVFSAAGTISEMRTAGMHIEADDHESFFRWIVDNPSLTLQEIKNEADAQIADLETELRKLYGQYIEEDPFLKQKAEVPGHHN
jgi:hypothetical protein